MTPAPSWAFAGSGTTLRVAAVELGRNAIGIELNPEYADIADRLLNQTQPALFGIWNVTMTATVELFGVSSARKIRSRRRVPQLCIRHSARSATCRSGASTVTPMQMAGWCHPVLRPCLGSLFAVG